MVNVSHLLDEINFTQMHTSLANSQLINYNTPTHCFQYNTREVCEHIRRDEEWCIPQTFSRSIFVVRQKNSIVRHRRGGDATEKISIFRTHKIRSVCIRVLGIFPEECATFGKMKRMKNERVTKMEDGKKTNKNFLVAVTSVYTSASEKLAPLVSCPS